MSSRQLWSGSLAHPRVGPLWVALSPDGLVAVLMRSSADEVQARFGKATVTEDRERVAPVLAQLDAYLKGELKGRSFEVTIDWSGLSSFQERVLRLVAAIPYGQTRTYQEIAEELGQPGAARAVGRANATNPMPLIIPCHRVLGSDGGLHGYGGAGGVETKAWLLQLEGSRLL